MPIVPSDLSGLQLWLKADAGVYKDAAKAQPCASGEAVYTWADQTANVFDGVQSTSARRPIYRTGRISSLPSIEFTGTSYHYLTHGYNGNANTVFVIGRLTDTSTTRDNAWMGADQTTGGNPIGAYYLKPSSGTGVSSGTSWERSNTSGSTFIGSSYRSFGSMWFAHAGRVNGTAVTSWVNGSQVGAATLTGTASTVASGTGVIGTAWYNHTLAVGTYPYNWFTGDIAEVIIFDRALSDLEMGQVFDYLNAKYFPPQTLDNYVFPSFLDSTNVEYGKLLHSADGLTFAEVTPFSVIPKTGTVRDPSIKLWNGSYYLACTTKAFSQSTSFEIFKSANLSGPYRYWATVDCSTATGGGAGARTWSPIWFVDPNDNSLHLLVSCATDITANSNTGNFKQYHLEPTAADLSTWGAPTEITDIAGVYASTIAGFIIRKSGTYYLWCKNELPVASGGKYNVVFSSSSPFSGYTLLYSGDWAGWGQNTYEGAHVVLVSGTTWIAYLDQYPTGGEHYSQSDDDWATWTAVSPLTGATDAHNGIIFRQALSY